MYRAMISVILGIALGQSPSIASSFATTVQVAPKKVTSVLIQYVASDIPGNDAKCPPSIILATVMDYIKLGVRPETIVVAYDWDGTVLGKRRRGDEGVRSVGGGNI